MPITGDVADRFRFLRLLYFMNDEFFNEDWEEQIARKPFGYRPAEWPERIPLVSVLAYTLMPNHFHLVLKETKDGGVSTFMQKLGQSVTVHFNLKYNQRGSIFQGSYRSRTIEDDKYFQYVIAYVTVKNTFEMYPKDGLKGAVKNFEAAWDWAIEYPFSSLGACVLSTSNPIVDEIAVTEILQDTRDFKVFARDVMAGGKWGSAEFE